MHIDLSFCILLIVYTIQREAGIKPDPEIDAFMKAIVLSGQKSSFVTNFVLKILGLDICADIMVGDEMRRGISGGQKKRVTTGEVQVGPAQTLFMDEISTGVDSSTTFQICKFMRQVFHTLDAAVIVSLLQPAPETFELFDDIILLSEVQIVYQGLRENVLEFFVYMGFRCPERKGIDDFLQVTSKKNQQQNWFRRDNHCATPHTSVAVVADEFFKLNQNEDGLPAIRDSWFDCQKLTMPNSGMKQILNIFALVPCTQLETENFNLKTNKRMSPYSLLLVPFATTIGSWKNATQNCWKVEKLLFYGKILISLHHQLVPLYGYIFCHNVEPLHAHKYTLQTMDSY